MVYINMPMIQQVLAERRWAQRLTKEVMPLICGHINPYGLFLLDLRARLSIETDIQQRLRRSPCGWWFKCWVYSYLAARVHLLHDKRHYRVACEVYDTMPLSNFVCSSAKLRPFFVKSLADFVLVLS